MSKTIFPSLPLILGNLIFMYFIYNRIEPLLSLACGLFFFLKVSDESGWKPSSGRAFVSPSPHVFSHYCTHFVWVGPGLWHKHLSQAGNLLSYKGSPRWEL